jgi:hypothetical protein
MLDQTWGRTEIWEERRILRARKLKPKCGPGEGGGGEGRDVGKENDVN